MCEFISWTEYKGKLYYISNYELNTPDGQALRRKLNYDFYEEIKGHGAIKTYFGLPHSKCKDNECSDFSTPNNFPAEIAEKIKAGEFSEIGVAEGLLTQPARAEYEKVEQPARAEYEKVKQSAWAEYKKVKQSAFWKLYADPKNRIEAWR